MNRNLLSINNLRVVFNPKKPTAHHALKGVNLAVRQGEVVGLVGESGSGKTVMAYSVLGLLPANGIVEEGRIEWLEATNLSALSEPEMRRIRGGEIAMIFQDPQASLNPVYRAGQQIEWTLKQHRGLQSRAARQEVMRLFEAVQLRDPERCYRSYPHELSGGMCQRVMIAMAIAGRPKLLIADEPTSALDVSVAAEIVALLAELRESLGLTILIITHDLSVATRLADRIAVLDQGVLVEDVVAARFVHQTTHMASRKLIDASRFLSAALSAEPPRRQDCVVVNKG